MNCGCVDPKLDCSHAANRHHSSGAAYADYNGVYEVLETLLTLPAAVFVMPMDVPGALYGSHAPSNVSAAGALGNAWSFDGTRTAVQVPRPNIREPHSAMSTRAPVCIA